MDTVSFLHALHEEIGISQGAGRRHMIHFPSAAMYHRCKQELRRLKSSFPNLSSVQDLQIIRAFSCSLPHDTKLRKVSWIHSIEEDTKIKVHRLPDIKNHSSTSKKKHPGQPMIPWGVGHIRAPEAWKHSLGSRVHIGVIDTGIDYHHPDLKHSIARGVNLLNRSLLPYDDNGHGTHIAGTIAAASSQYGIVGVAPRATIHPVKAFDYNGSAYVSDIIAGIDWCVHQKLDIINMSFGMKKYSKALEYAVLNAYQSGTIIVASSGNDGRRATVDYPARFPQVVSVGATTRANKIAPFSNKGKRIDVYAPGERIYSAWLHGKYNELSGTSMATAHVSGVIALMKAVRPGLRAQQAKRILKRCSSTLSKTGSALKQHPGQINARRALSALK